MTAKVDLKEIADAIDSGMPAYVDVESGTVNYRFDELEDEQDVDEGRHMEEIFFECNVGYAAMEAYIRNLGDILYADKLWRAISGNGAFGRFRTAVDILGIEDDWYSFRERFMLEKAREWCEDNEIDYID